MSTAPLAPTRRVMLANFAVFQLSWFAAVLGAAHDVALWGTLCIAAAIGWHVAVSARPAKEVSLIGAALLIGLVFETLVVAMGNVRYPTGQALHWLAPYWLVSLWGAFAITLNVTLRWLRGRPWLAGVLGAVAGPASFAAGVRLGAASFVNTAAALLTLAIGWALLMPLLMRLAVRFDGVCLPHARSQHG